MHQDEGFPVSRRGVIAGGVASATLAAAPAVQAQTQGTAGDHATARHRKTFILMHIKSLYLLA